MRLPFFLLGLLVAFTAVAAGDSSVPVVRSIQIRGSGAGLSQPGILRAQMQTRVGLPYSEKTVEEDLRRLQKNPKLSVPRIFGVPVPDGVEVIVVVQPASHADATLAAAPGSLPSFRAVAVGIGAPVACWLFVAGLCLCIPRASAATRHLLWRLAFLALAVCLCITLFPFELSIPVPAIHAPASVPPPAPRVAPLDGRSGLPSPDFGPIKLPHIDFGQVENAPVSPAPPAISASAAPAQSPHGLPWRNLLLATWLGGLVFFTLTRVAGIFRLRQILARARPATTPGLTTLWSELLAHYPFLAGARLRLSAEVSVPLVTGLRRPVILLPAAAADWPATVLRASLLHEAAHL
ncbi:MAG: M56 family metallopeptidase, partial [Chthoniobacter sp.]